jgi:HD-GYP domain-containing protein (c-di-GMP phosphodiesterase class II)
MRTTLLPRVLTIMATVVSGAPQRGPNLLLKRVKIDTANVERGMYVAQLDRSWLETPFLFQGFEIREPGEIELLRKFCKHCYIDVTRSSVPKKRVLEARKRSPAADPFANRRKRGNVHRSVPLSRRLLSSLSRLDPTGKVAARLNQQKHYRNTVSTRAEAPRAVEAYEGALGKMDEVFHDIREGSGVQVDKVKEAVTPMIESVMRNQDAMAWLIYLRKRDEYTYNHSIASSVWAIILGRHLGFDRQGLATLAMGGVLLDIGKAKIPSSIIMKEGPLDEEEINIVRMHVPYGLDIAGTTPGISDDILAMIRSHHERHDGSGYPEGLAGADIPVYGRISGIVDCFDAMTTNRPYAPAKSSYDAIRELNLLAGGQFQRELVEQFVQALGMFPTGSVVELNTGEIGIVIEQNRVRRLRPKLMLLLDRQKRPLDEHKTLDLRRLPSDESNRKAYWIVGGHEPGAFGIDPKDYFV